MSKKSRWGYILLVLLSLFAIRCSLSTGFFRSEDRSYRSSSYEFANPLLWNFTSDPSPSPTSLPNNISTPVNTNSSSVANATIPVSNNATIVSEYPTIVPGIFDTPKVSPIWGHMVKHLRKPNITEEATKAMREGLRAWKEVNASMKEKYANHTSDQSVDSKCPYFVSALNATELKQEPFLLPIPCGLVLDSSVTVIGVPGVSTGRFSLELIGSVLFGEDDEPVVFHMSVRLRGDPETENPTIVHNTWTVGGDWATEQRCPLPPKSEPELETTG